MLLNLNLLKGYLSGALEIADRLTKRIATETSATRKKPVLSDETKARLIAKKNKNRI